ncbi:hypothetical protein [Paenibacillus uliginis]|uniref:hypothetical protein n=1 Tax=Paenibacillus uliginis TaxID=683737 RepID=UPI001AD83885|nr:hypothetical protein [Paenibacillus uliginis]
MSAKWAYAFVVNDGKVFVITEEVVAEVLLGKVVGKVTNYSSDETAYSGGNFSNVFPKGTKYYSIQGIPPEEAIAVKTNELVFVKALFDREYGGSDDTIQPKQHSEMAADNGIKDNSVIVLTVLLSALAVLFMIITAVVLNNRRI